MTYSDTASYFFALLAIYLAPGPIVLLLIVRTASNDLRGAIGFALGTAVGSLTILTAVCFGISAWFSADSAVFAYSKYLMLAYLLWIARDIWIGGFDLSGDVKPHRSGFLFAMLAGFVTCITSPFMLILFPLVLPEVMNLSSFQMPEFIIITAVTFAADAAAAIIAVGLAFQLRRLARSPRSMRIMNRSLATILVSGGGWLALA